MFSLQVRAKPIFRGRVSEKFRANCRDFAEKMNGLPQKLNGVERVEERPRKILQAKTI